MAIPAYAVYKMEVKTSNSNVDYYFLAGGGEMGAITRAFNWQETALGGPEEWSLSLRNTVAMVLSSRFPMFLWWGDELIQFYNDAFLPSLGSDGKHPAVGKRAIDTWPETWHFIGPLIERVMQTGEPAWYENQLVSYYRNGRIEDVYWTFSYSPVWGDSGTIEGVMAICYESTETVKNLQRLTESERRFQSLIMDAAVGIVVLEGDENTVTIVNNAYLNLVGRSFSKLINRPLFSVIPEAEDYFRPIIQKVRETGIPYNLNMHPYKIHHDNGGVAEGYINATYQPYMGADGSTIGVMVLCHDVTEQVAARQELEKSEQQVRAVINSAPFPIGVYIGREMRIALLNQSIIDVWGKGSDIIGKTYFEVLPELEDQDIYPQLTGVFDTGIPFSARHQRVDLVVDGVEGEYYFNYDFTPLLDANGAVYGVMNTAADVTDLVMSKKKIEQSEQNFRNLILQAPVAMCLLLGPEHVVEVANEAMINLWGKVPEEVMQRPIFEGLPDAREQGLEQLLDEVFTSGVSHQANEMPVHLVRYGKPETVYQNFIYEPYKDVSGNILGVIAISHNVTEQVEARRRIEELVEERTHELMLTNDNLSKSNEELAQFAYIASHDLQEPLRKIGMFSQMLEARLGSALDEKSSEQLAKINQSAKRMQSLVKDVLGYSQLNTQVIETEPVDLNDVLEGVLTDFELLIEQKNATIASEGLPVIQGHFAQLSQLFSNLIGNSIKFAAAGKPPVITIGCRTLSAQEKDDAGLSKRKAYYLLKFSDNGIGFEPEYAQRIFNIFQRLHQKSEYEGTGIGLAICKKIVSMHNGLMDAEGSSRDGAVFNIILPAGNNE